MVLFLLTAKVFGTVAGPTLTTLFTFNGVNGAGNQGSFIADASGNLYATTVNGGTGYGHVFEFNPTSRKLTQLVTFTDADGAHPYRSLLFDSTGNLYGTLSGNTTNFGSVYEVAKTTNALSTLATFAQYVNGADPVCALIADGAGNLYGTTSLGGSAGYGTVFEVAQGTNTLSTLVTFNSANGQEPNAGLVADASGNMYGTTEGGSILNDGTIFELAAGSHAFSTIAAFNGTNGAQPTSALTIGPGGNLYGTTFNGGMYGKGTVFEVDKVTHAVTSLHSFDGDDGSGPFYGVIADAAGDLFGTTLNGGGNSNGTAFEITAGTDAFSTIATFGGSNGASPNGLLADSAGNLYGMTTAGNGSGGGTIFEITGSNYVVSVPEPTSFAMLGVTLLCMYTRPRRRL